MSSYSKPRLINRTAGADLSTSIYKAVKLDANGHVIAATANSKNIGFLMNAPLSGEIAEVASFGGGALGRAGNTINAGDSLKSDANGALVATTTSGDFVVAIAMESAVTNDQFYIEPVLYTVA